MEPKAQSDGSQTAVKAQKKCSTSKRPKKWELKWPKGKRPEKPEPEADPALGDRSDAACVYYYQTEGKAELVARYDIRNGGEVIDCELEGGGTVQRFLARRPCLLTVQSAGQTVSLQDQEILEALLAGEEPPARPEDEETDSLI